MTEKQSTNVAKDMKKQMDDIILRIDENFKNNREYRKRKQIMTLQKKSCLHAIFNFSSELEELGSFMGEMKIMKVLEILEKSSIIKYVSEKTKRELLLVKGTPDQNGCQSINLLFPNLPFCTCFSFGRQVIRREILFCKHYVAVRLATCFNKVETMEIPHNEFDAKIKLIRI